MNFWKYHGLGNDFILIDNFDGTAPTDPETVRRLCDRRMGIGADGILYVNSDKEADAFMKIMNADGSEAEMCGNGIRCVAKHLYDFSTDPLEVVRINTLAGVKLVRIRSRNGEAVEAQVDMGAPRLECKDVPMNCQGRFIDGDLNVKGRSIKGTAVSMGNPHFVTFDSISEEDMKILGPLIEAHSLFPRKTNVEFVRYSAPFLDVTVFERGAGWTMACGTGACASTVAAAIKGVVPFDHEVPVRLPGGVLRIKVPKDLSSVQMTGPAVRVFQGSMEV